MISVGDVTTWPTGCTEYEQARKVWEEAQEVWAAMYWGEGEDRVKAECADVIQATCNLLAMMGVEDFAPYMAACLEVQKGRGRL